jgi:hypothetical protein
MRTMAVATAEGSARLLPRLEAAHEQWVLIYAVFVGAISNALINTGLGWISIRNVSHVPLVGASALHPSLVTQALGTLFFLPFFTTLITTYGVREELANGNLVRLTPPDTNWWRRLFPQRLVARGARLGLVSLLVLGPIVTVLIVGLAHGGADRNSYWFLNSCLSVIYGAIATPIIAIAAMCDAPHAE